MLPHGCFPWLAYLKTMLHFNDVSKETVMQTSLYYPDQGDMTCSYTNELSANDGYFKRCNHSRASRTVEMCGPLICDLLFNSSGALMPNCDYYIKMFRQPHSFTIMSHETNEKFKLKVWTHDSVLLMVDSIYLKADAF